VDSKEENSKLHNFLEEQFTGFKIRQNARVKTETNKDPCDLQVWRKEASKYKEINLSKAIRDLKLTTQ
jgi:hypothetical protein